MNEEKIIADVVKMYYGAKKKHWTTLFNQAAKVFCANYDKKDGNGNWCTNCPLYGHKFRDETSLCYFISKGEKLYYYKMTKEFETMQKERALQVMRENWKPEYDDLVSEEVLDFLFPNRAKGNKFFAVYQKDHELTTTECDSFEEANAFVEKSEDKVCAAVVVQKNGIWYKTPDGATTTEW